MDETPRSAPQSGLYTTIALYAASNALSIAVFLILYHVSAVLADFRDAMLYAFLCSVALRAPKDWLVGWLDWHLSQDRSLILSLFTAIATPYTAVSFLWTEYQDMTKAFRTRVKEIKDEYQRNMERSRKQIIALQQQQQQQLQHNELNGVDPLPLPLLPRPPPSVLIYARAGLRTLTFRKDRKVKRRKRGVSAVRKRSNQASGELAASSTSTRLLGALVLLTLAWTGYEWVRDSWSHTSHVILLSGLMVAVVGAVLREVLNRLLFPTTSTLVSPAYTPQSPRGRAKGPPTSPTHTSPMPFTPPPITTTMTPPPPPTPPAIPTALESPRYYYASSARTIKQFTLFLCTKLTKAITIMESPLRALLRRQAHIIVSLFLIVGLLVGTTGAAAFLSLRIIGEARGVVLAARDAFPTAWPSLSTTVTPLLFSDTDLGSSMNRSTTAETTNANNRLLGIKGVGTTTSTSRSLHQVASEVPLPPWLESYRQSALDLAQRSLPQMAHWVERKLYGVMRDHNLTDTLWDARLLYEAAQGPRSCSESERGKLLVALAKAEVGVRRAREEEGVAAVAAAEAQRRLSVAVAELSAAMMSSSLGSVSKTGGGHREHASSCESSQDFDGPCADDPSTTSTTTTRSSNNDDAELAKLQERIVEADAILTSAKGVHKAAAAVLDEAERRRHVTDGRAQLCIIHKKNSASTNGSSDKEQKGRTLGGEEEEEEEGLMAGIGLRLGSAYDKLFWQWRLREGISELHGSVMYAINSITQRSGTTAAADLTRLQRLAQVAAIPLFGLGRAAASSVGTTTAAAVMGSLGLFRLGLGVVHAGVQAALFLTLLYYLLSAQTDPLARAVGLLPIPPSARVRAATALNAALGGVFMSLLKLSLFHGLFAWVTFRIFNAPLAYTSAVASAAFSLLPFVPTYSVALPSCAVVALHGRVAAAIALLLLHFGAYYIGDTVVLEDSGGHPFMMSLAILGGLWAFSNPLLGCLLGPTLLSLLSALGALHTELMAQGASGGSATQSPQLLFSPTVPLAGPSVTATTTPPAPGRKNELFPLVVGRKSEEKEKERQADIARPPHGSAADGTLATATRLQQTGSKETSPHGKSGDGDGDDDDGSLSLGIDIAGRKDDNAKGEDEEEEVVSSVKTTPTENGRPFSFLNRNSRQQKKKGVTFDALNVGL